MKSSRTVAKIFGVMAVTGALIMGTVVPASAVTSSEASSAQTILTLTNKIRSDVKVSSLKRNSGVDKVAQAWSEKMLKEGRLYHNPNYSSQIPGGWSAAAENVGYACGYGGAANNAEVIVDGWKNSAGHYRNMTNRTYNNIGIGVAYDSGSDCMFATQNFATYATSSSGSGSSGSGSSGSGSSGSSVGSAFIDVSPKTAFAKEIQWAYDNGVTKGWKTSKGREFRPTATMDRNAMAAFLYREFGEGDSVNMNVLKKFKDVNSKTPFAKEIAWMAQYGITTGYSDGTFRPYDSVNRDAMAAFLYRVAVKEKIAGNTNVTVKDATSKFSDVKGNPHAKSIAWMVKNGITTGYSDGTYRPQTPVKRDAIIAFIYRLSN